MVAKKDELSRISSGKIEILKTQLKEKTKEKQQRKVSKKKKKRQQYKWLKQIYLELEEIKTRLDVLEAKMGEVEKTLARQRTHENFRRFFEEFFKKAKD